MQYTTIALFGLVAMATAFPSENVEAVEMRKGKGHPKPSPKPSPGGGKRHKLRKVSKTEALRCTGSLGSAGAQCGGNIANEVNAAAEQGADITQCAFDVISGLADCRGLFA